MVVKPCLNCFCNCDFCASRQAFYSQRRAEKRQKISLSKYIEVFSEAKKLGVEVLQISGGEPLLYPDLISVIREARKLNWFVFINSVGKGVSEQKATELLDAGLGAFNISIDSHDSQVHDSLRNLKGLLIEAKNTLKLFSNIKQLKPEYRDFNTNILTIILKNTFQELPLLVDLLFDYNVSSWYLMYPYNDSTHKFILELEEIKIFKERVVEQIVERIALRTTESQVVSYADKILKNFYSVEQNSLIDFAVGNYWRSLDAAKRGCSQPNETLMILETGEVLPCCVLENKESFVLGNIHTETLTDIWTGYSASAFRHARSSFCQQCPSALNRTIGLNLSMLRQF